MIHLAAAALVNAIWDLYAKIQKKPLWKCLVEMDPDELISTMDFRYMYVNQFYAYIMLNNSHKNKSIETSKLENGFSILCCILIVLFFPLYSEQMS